MQSLPPPQTFDSMSWDKPSLEVPGDSDVASIWDAGNQQYTAKAHMPL